MLTSEDVKKAALEMGADLVGLASASELNENPPDAEWPQIPSKLWPECRTVICLAKRMPWGAYRSGDAVVTRYTPQLVMNRLESLALDLCYFLEEQGNHAAPTPLAYTDTALKRGTYGSLSLRHVAVEAGLGTLGLNMMLITPQYGPRVYLTAVLTDADLSADGRLSQQLCLGPSCGRCLLACPPDAVRHWGLDKRRCSTRAQAYGLSQLFTHLNRFLEAKTREEKWELVRSADSINFWQATLGAVGAYGACPRCLEVCPVGEDYKHHLREQYREIPEATEEKRARLAEMLLAEDRGQEIPGAVISRRWISG
ncbi:MAG: hypothetical protein ACE5NP_13405 [Anaerolineae bacterium]